MPPTYWIGYMTRRRFEDEPERRLALALARAIARSRGYTGRFSFAELDLHGRPGYLIQVRIHP